SVTGTAGLTSDDGRLKPINSLRFAPVAQPPALTASGRAALSLRAELTLSMYGVGGPTINLDPGLDLKADVDADPWWTLDATLAAGASLRVPKLGVSTPVVQLFRPPLRRRIASAAPRGSIVFSGGPGTSAPPATLGRYTMKRFGADPQAVGASVTGVTGPTGRVGFLHGPHPLPDTHDQRLLADLEPRLQRRRLHGERHRGHPDAAARHQGVLPVRRAEHLRHVLDERDR
ncbi:MAG TPA: hypothetical protein VHJ17_07330, partial [Thermomonospora sp.]|nr:hypothetical protein [Thermomonospora sp.]